MNSGNVRIISGFTFTGTQIAQGVAGLGLKPGKKADGKTFAKTLQYGTASGLIDTIIFQPRELAGAATETLNLFDGSLLDIFKETGGLQTLREIYIQQIANADASTASTGATIGNAALNGTQLWFGAVTHTYTLNGLTGIPFHQGDDAGVTIDNTHKNVLITNNHATRKFTYLLALAGRHV